MQILKCKHANIKLQACKYKNAKKIIILFVPITEIKLSGNLLRRISIKWVLYENPICREKPLKTHKPRLHLKKGSNIDNPFQNGSDLIWVKLLRLT